MQGKWGIGRLLISGLLGWFSIVAGSVYAQPNVIEEGKLSDLDNTISAISTQLAALDTETVASTIHRTRVQTNQIDATLFDDILAALAVLETATQVNIPKNRAKPLLKKLDNAAKAVTKADKQLAKGKQKQAKQQLRKAHRKLRQYQAKLKKLKRKAHISKAVAQALRAQSKDIILLIKAALQGGPIDNTAPVADAGLDQTVAVGETATLDGSGSSDADGDPLDYQWTLLSQPAGSQAVLSDETLVNPTLLIDTQGEYVIELIVEDGIDESVADTVTLSTINSPPMAAAGSDQTGQVGELIQLDGSGSSDADSDVLSYQWAFVNKPTTSSTVLQAANSVNPTFVIDAPGTYEVELIVNDGSDNSAPDQVVIVTENTAPVADTGADQTVALGAVVTLDGSGSSDVDGDSLSYAWSLISVPEDSDAELSDPAAVMPSFVADQPGTYIAQLIVNDRSDDSTPDTVTITTENTIPVAEAGPDQTVVANTLITLDGSGSTDIDGDLLSYAWSLTSIPTGSSATLNDPTAVMPRFLADLPGPYVAQLIVNDGALDSLPDTVTVTAENIPPVAEAGPDQSVALGATVTLDGSSSSDVNNDPLSYAWSLLSAPADSTADLVNPASVSPSFVVDEAGLYVVQLIVNDGRVDSAHDEVRVSTLNTRPVAEAGDNQNVFINEIVQLDGSSSSDADGDTLSYQWDLLSVPAGSNASLTGASTVTPSFDADVEGVYVIQLIVSDGLLDSDPDTATITAQNRLPIADAGLDQNAEVGDTVTLDGSASSDPDNDPLSYFWSLSVPAGSSVSLSNPQAVQPSFVPDQAGTYQADLVVNDGFQDSFPDTVSITVNTANQAPDITSTPLLTVTVGQLYNYDVAADDPDGDTLTFSLSQAPAGMSIDPASGLIAWTPNAAGDFDITVDASDPDNLTDSQSFTIAVSAANTAPIADAGEDQTVTVGEVALLDGTGSSDPDSDPLSYQWTITSQPVGSVAALVDADTANPSLTPDVAGEYVVELVVNDGLVDSNPDTVTITAEADTPLPPDPSEVAPPVDPTVATTVYAATAFLYTGPNPIQTGVLPGTIEPKRTAVLRGRVLERSDTPLSGVTITIHNHPEYGQTLSRADGMFDLVANGGGLLTVDYQKAGYLPVQRQISSVWQDWSILPDVVMIPLDSAVTVVDLDQPGIKRAQGNPVTDQDGTRQATMLFPEGATAEMVLPDGSTQPLTSLTVRATEYTVGPNGPETMPAELPPTSGYTYAVELSVDEALAAGATMVQFSQPVPFYVENFLDFPVGTAVPVGYYDRAKVQWIAAPNGLVIEVLDTAGGLATVDSDGDGVADDALGLGDAERAEMANLYSVGQTLWRVLIDHFTPWDCNWPRVPPDDAAAPDPPPAAGGDDQRSEEPQPDECNEKPSGSGQVDCQRQTQSQSVSIVGVPFDLSYSSDRSEGYQPRYDLTIPLSGSTLPHSLKRINLEITVAGRKFTETFTATPNQSTKFQWDGNDAYDQSVNAPQPVNLRIGYVYDALYAQPGEFERSFASLSGVPISGSRAREEITLWQDQTQTVGQWRPKGLVVDQWSLTVHHAYDPVGRRLYLGNGQQRSAQAVKQGIITTLFDKFGALNASCLLTATEDCAGFPAEDVSSPVGGPSPRDVITQADGSILFSTNSRLHRIGSDGILSTVAGTGVVGFSGDGGLATQAQLWSAQELSIGPDGSIFVLDASNFRIRRIDPTGIITTVAGNGISESSGDGGLATEASIRGVRDIGVSADGSLFIAEVNRIRRVGTDGIITAFAGTGASGFSGDGGPALEATFSSISSIVVGPDGRVLVSGSSRRVRQIGIDGIVNTIAGGGLDTSDGIPALSARLVAGEVAFTADRNLLINQNTHIRLIDSEGIIKTIAGKIPFESSDQFIEGGAATRTRIRPQAIAVAPDASIIYRSSGGEIRRVAPVVSGFDDGDIAISSKDSAQIYRFDPAGRHLSTINALTGAMVHSFAYDGQGRLNTITDGDGNTTTIERNGGGDPGAIVAQDGQRTTITLDANGRLAALSNPAGETSTFGYTDQGLMTRAVNPRQKETIFSYNALGRLELARDAANADLDLSRTELDGGYQSVGTSALGLETKFRVEALADGTQQRITTFPDGTQTQVSDGLDGSQTVTVPDGTVISFARDPDARFGMQAPVAGQRTLTTGTLIREEIVERSVELVDSNDPLSLVSITDTVSINGRASTSVYMANDRTTTTTSAEGRTVAVQTDMQSRPTLLQVPGIDDLTLGYDTRGRLESIAQGVAGNTRTTGYAYDADGYLGSVTDAENRTMGLIYDLAGRVTEQNLPGSRTVLYAYDANGNLTSLTPPGKPAHTFTYTDIDLVESYNPPVVPGSGATSTVYDYNADKQLELVTRPDGLVLDYAYDTAGRLDTLTIPRGVYDYDYDGATGQLTMITDPAGGTLDYGYTGALLTQVTQAGEVSGSVGFVYDNDLRTSEIRINGVEPVVFGYDDDSLLTQAGDLTLNYDPANGLLSGTSLGGVSDSYGYNGFGEVESYSADFSGAPVYEVGYVRDKLGRITQKTETIASTTTVFDYTYDAAGRLDTVTIDDVLSADYGYDENGNRLSKTGPGINEIGSYDDQDRLLAYDGAVYSYTANGELQTKTENGLTTTYSYDVLGNLVQVVLPDSTQIDYVIDGRNRRVGKKVDGVLVQGFLYQDQLNPVAELDGSGVVVSRFVYGSRVNVPDYLVKGGQAYRVVTDQLGSPRLVVNVSNGSVVQRLDYDEFGNVLLDTNPGFQPFGFAGGLYDLETQLVRFGARDYDAGVGRWTAKDFSLFWNTDEWNLYNYVKSDSLNRTDSSGFESSSTLPPHGVDAKLEFSDALSPLSARFWLQSTDGAYRTREFTCGEVYTCIAFSRKECRPFILRDKTKVLEALAVTLRGNSLGALFEILSPGPPKFDSSGGQNSSQDQ